MKKKTLKIIISMTIIFVLYIILDYINLPTILRINPEHINLELFGILFDAFIVITLFVISFFILTIVKMKRMLMLEIL